MKIKLDNLDSVPGSVLVIAESAEAARDDQSIDGARWEYDDDFAYTTVLDRSGLVEDLKDQGYEIDTTEYCPTDEEELLDEN